MTDERQAELIATACKEAGLDGHIKWIKRAKDAQTWAERIAERFRNSRQLPVKNSYMYCDKLDMCFFYGETGTPHMAYAGYVTASSPDITEGKLLEAFRRARQILSTMKELAEG
ncbi:MAG: hypothetical protein KH334_02800 [Clostridiales bacterium]|nr:hypothetical protein [Clostridiales bacterium]